nr:FH protein interacting protein FIP2-like isoform X1 [Coffea arabica]
MNSISSHGGFSSIIRLNIGGKKFCTTVDTLTHREPDSMLAAMFSGRHTLSHESDKGYVFVDRDGKHFRHILNWLRDGAVPMLKDSEYLELLREAEYYQLLGLIDGIKTALSKKKEEEELGTELTRIDIIKCIQSERVRFRGVNLSGLDLSKLDLSYVDFGYACLKNVFFSRANLHCAKFKDVDAEASIFHNATLRKMRIYWSQPSWSFISRCQSSKCKLTRFGVPSLEGTTDDVTYMGFLALLQSLVDIVFLATDACLVDCSFCGADLRSAHLQTADLTNANLEGANLEGANLKGAKLTNANLKGANLQRAYLRHVNLRETQLEGAKLDGANLLGTIR